jgi:hypothetical protein
MGPRNLPIMILVSILTASCTFGCTRHKIEVAPVEVKPIHITIDINVKVDRELDDFFGDLDETEQEIKGSSSDSNQ